MLRQVMPSSATEAFAVEANDLVKDFGTTRAVDGVSLAVPAGSLYGLLGPPGAGPTTTASSGQSGRSEQFRRHEQFRRSEQSGSDHKITRP